MLTIEIQHAGRTVLHESSSRPVEIAVALTCLMGTQRPTSRQATTPDGDPCELTIAADTHEERTEFLEILGQLDPDAAAWADGLIEVQEMRLAA